MSVSGVGMLSARLKRGPIKDISILSLMLARLRNLGLITNDEKLEMDLSSQSNATKIALFDMLLKKDVATASKMFLAIRSVDLENDISQNTCKIISNPMQTYTIIKNILGFLNLEDVKSCRLINKSWNSVAGLLLRKRSVIAFGSEVDKDNIEPIRTPAKFLETYAESSITKSFDSFLFRSRIDLHNFDLTNFLLQQKNIKGLDFEEVKLIDEKGHELENYDINDWLVGSPLTKLDIECNESTTLTFSLDKLHSISEIYLDACVVKVPNSKGCRMSPITFDIWDVTWQLENGESIIEVSLNDFIDFHKVKYIRMMASSGSNVIFDISECVHLKSLELHSTGVTVINWNRAKTTVDYLGMEGIPFLEKTEMKINKLCFKDSSIDLFALPWAIEKLNLEGESTVLCSQPITLPNLKAISCKIEADMLNNFANCANLVDIDFDVFTDEDEDDTILNTNCIPKSVKRIKMGKVKIFGPILNLKTLVLTDCSLIDAVGILKKIKPKVLVLKWLRNFEANESVLEFLKQLKDILLFIGPFDWSGDLHPKYENSKLATYVDKEATYYAFGNNLGKGVKEEGFNAMCNLIID